MQINLQESVLRKKKRKEKEKKDKEGNMFMVFTLLLPLWLLPSLFTLFPEPPKNPYPSHCEAAEGDFNIDHHPQVWVFLQKAFE